MRFFNSPIHVVDRVAFGHNGQHLIAAGSNVPDLRLKPDNRGIAIWDVTASAIPMDHLYPNQLIAGFVINPANDWLYLATGFEFVGDDNSAYHAVQLTTGKSTVLAMSGGNALVLSVHATGRWLIAAGYCAKWTSRLGWRDQQIARWKQPTRHPPVEEWKIPAQERRYIGLIACDPGGTRFVTHEIEEGQLVVNLSYDLRLRDSVTGIVREIVPVPSRTIHQVLFSPDGQRLIVRAGSSFLVWDATDFARKPVKVTGGRLTFTDIAFHPSGRYLAATSNDTTVKLYDTTTWELAKTFTWDIGRMRSISFSPDGSLAAAGSDTGKVVVWDVDI